LVLSDIKGYLYILPIDIYLYGVYIPLPRVRSSL